MKQENRINTALKNALSEHRVEVHEPQWLWIQAALEEKPVKKRVFPWLMFALTLSCLGIGYWLGHNSQRNSVAETTLTAAKINTNKVSNASDKNTSGIHSQESPYSGNERNEKSNELSKNSDLDNNRTITNSQTKSPSAKKRKILRRFSNETDKTFFQSTYNAGLGTNNKNEGGLAFSGNGDKDNTVTTSPIKEEEDKNSAGEMEIKGEISKTGINDVDSILNISSVTDDKEHKDTAPKPILIPKDDDDKDPEINKRFSFNIAAGVSGVKFDNVNISRPEKQHKDNQLVHEKTLNGTWSYFFNLGFDVKIWNNLRYGVSGGIQYRQFYNKLNFEHKLSNVIIFRSADSTIQGYRTDSFPIEERFTSKNTMRFINVPLKFYYALPMGDKNELMFSAGLNISFLTGLKGKTFSLDEFQVKPLEESYKRTPNIGVMAGLQYSRLIYKSFWLGFEGQLQQNKLRYYDAYGSISTRATINSLNLNFRYKF